MKKDKKNIGIKKSADVIREDQGFKIPVTASADFSVSVFDNPQDNKFNVTTFITQYSGVEKDSKKIWDMVEKYNELLKPPFLREELVKIFNEVLNIKIEFAPSLSFKELMSQEFPKARYTIEPFFEQGTVNMVSAPPNTWKSWLLFYFAAHIASGTQPFERFETEQSKVMIVNEEDSFRAIQDRFKILDITDTTLPIYFRVANGSKFETKFVNKLIEELKEKEIKVVIFDSLRSMHEADENDSTAMQKILDQMKRISREGITVIFTHHHRKKGMFEKTSSAESSRGSSAINAAISGHISLDEEERDTGLFLIIKHLKSKAGEKLVPFEVKIVKEDDKIKFIYEGEFTGAQKKIMKAKDGIMEKLNEKDWRPIKDFEEMGISKTIIKQALQSLKMDGLVLSVDRKHAITKSIAVTEKGNARELYYALNTESSEAVAQTDEEAVQEDFDNF